MRNFYIVRIEYGDEPIITPVPDTSPVDHALKLIVAAHPESPIFLLETTETNAWMYSAERALRQIDEQRKE